MKKKLMKSMALGTIFAAAVCGGAQANGVFDAGNVNYAVEGLTAATTFVADPVVYTIGVDRTVAQDITLKFTLPAGVTFTAIPAIPGGIVTAGGGAVAIPTLKRGGVGTNEVVFDLDVTTAMVGGTTSITLTGFEFGGTAAATLKAPGSTIPLSLLITENGETAVVDNVGNGGVVTSNLATSVQVVDFWNGLAAPNSTRLLVTDLDHTTVNAQADPPMTQFVATAPDTTAIADAQVSFTVQRADVRNAANTEDWNPVAGDVVTLVVTDINQAQFVGVEHLFLDLNRNNLYDIGEEFTIPAGSNTATKVMAGDAFAVAVNNGALGASGEENGALSLKFENDGATRMNTTARFAISGSIDPQVDDIDFNFASQASPFWTWTSNGSILQVPLAQMASGWECRTVLTNVTGQEVFFSVDTLTEDGASVVANLTEGLIPASGVLFNRCSDFITSVDNGNPRAAIRFTVSAPNGSVNGLYQLLNPAAGSVSNHVMINENQDI